MTSHVFDSFRVCEPTTGPRVCRVELLTDGKIVRRGRKTEGFEVMGFDEDLKNLLANIGEVVDGVEIESPISEPLSHLSDLHQWYSDQVDGHDVVLAFDHSADLDWTFG